MSSWDPSSLHEVKRDDMKRRQQILPTINVHFDNLTPFRNSLLREVFGHLDTLLAHKEFHNFTSLFF